MAPKKYNITRELLESMREKGLGHRKMAVEIGCADATIMYWMRKYNIPRLPVGKPVNIVVPKEERVQRSKRARGKNNPFYGKKHTTQTRKKMSENHADIHGDNNPYRKALKKDPTKREAARKRALAYWKNLSTEEKVKRSAKLSKSVAESLAGRTEQTHKNHKAQRLATVKGGEIFCRSSWEVYVAQQLDNVDEVVSFQLEPFCIKYTDADRLERYTRVDFVIEMVNGTTIMIEVKPQGLRTWGNNPEKIKAYKKYCRKHHMYFGLVGKPLIGKDAKFRRFLVCKVGLR